MRANAEFQQLIFNAEGAHVHRHALLEIQAKCLGWLNSNY